MKYRKRLSDMGTVVWLILINHLIQIGEQNDKKFISQ